MLLQFHLNNFKFCKAQDFTLEKISTLLSIMNFVFNESMNNKLGRRLSEALLQDLIVKHSIQRPPYSVEIFAYGERDTVFKWA
jgi:hypothetical protein